MRVIGRVLVALSVALPLSLAITAGTAHSDSGSGPAVIKCMHWKDVMKIAPGVGNAPADQAVTAHGRLYGCNKAGGAAQFTGQLLMSGATCSDLGMSGTGQFEWANGEHSTAFLSFQPQANEPRKVFVGGSITSGAFQGLIVQAWLRFIPEFTGSGVNCGPDNLLRKIRFTNTQSFQLLSPNISSTTQAPGTTTPGTGTNPGTVPVTNQGGGTNPPPPVTVVIVRRPGLPIVIIHRRFHTGTLAFTGSSSLAALLGLCALLIGGALACLDPERRQRRLADSRRHRRMRSFLRVTLPRR